jgi:hypothetical protein
VADGDTMVAVIACRVAGFVALGLLLLMAGLLGAPILLLVMIGGFFTATAFLPGGTGAAALGNLARRLYDRRGWESHWSEGYLDEREEGPVARRRARRRATIDIPARLLPDDLQESKAWFRTLAAIRGLPERPPAARRGRFGRPFGPDRRSTRRPT